MKTRLEELESQLSGKGKLLAELKQQEEEEKIQKQEDYYEGRELEGNFLLDPLVDLASSYYNLPLAPPSGQNTYSDQIDFWNFSDPDIRYQQYQQEESLEIESVRQEKIQLLNEEILILEEQKKVEQEKEEKVRAEQQRKEESKIAREKRREAREKAAKEREEQAIKRKDAPVDQVVRRPFIGFFALSEEVKDYRKWAVKKFKEKKERGQTLCHFGKSVKYKVRKDFADQRPRVGGRFVAIPEEERTTVSHKRKKM